MNDLVAFDAAARNQSLTKGALELNVTQPAISRRIASLEAELGVSLFTRATKPMSLTNEGSLLFDVLRSSLNKIEAVVDELRDAAGSKSVTISSPGFVSFWLIPRLSQLQAAFPDWNMRILSEDDSRTSRSELQIRFGTGGWPELTSLQLFREDVFAVANPSYLAGRRVPCTLEEIQKMRLLRLTDSANWLGWKSWFASLGALQVDPPRTLDFDSYIHLVTAAVAGQGVALCWEGLLDDFLRDGTLVRVSERSVRSDRGYFITYESSEEVAQKVRKIAEWLLDSAAG